MRLLVLFNLPKILLCIHTVSTVCKYRPSWEKVYLDELDWSVVKISSDASKSDLDETRKKIKTRVAKLERVSWLTRFAFSWDLGTTGNSKVSCFVWWPMQSIPRWPGFDSCPYHILIYLRSVAPVRRYIDFWHSSGFRFLWRGITRR